jgi:hypothetical protein
VFKRRTGSRSQDSEETRAVANERTVPMNGEKKNYFFLVRRFGGSDDGFRWHLFTPSLSVADAIAAATARHSI